MTCRKCHEKNQHSHLTDAPVVITVPAFTDQWHAGYIDNPVIGRGYPTIPAMPRRKRLGLQAIFLAGTAVATETGIWIDSVPQTTTGKGFFLPALIPGNFPTNALAIMEHTGPVYATTELGGGTGVRIRLSWFAEIEAELPAPIELEPSFERDYQEGEPEATEPHPATHWPTTDQLDDITQAE